MTKTVTEGSVPVPGLLLKRHMIVIARVQQDSATAFGAALTKGLASGPLEAAKQQTLLERGLLNINMNNSVPHPVLC